MKYILALLITLVLAGSASANKDKDYLQSVLDVKEHTGFVNFVPAEHPGTIEVTVDGETSWCLVDDHSVSCNSYGGGDVVALDDGTHIDLAELFPIAGTDDPLRMLPLPRPATFQYRLAIINSTRFLVVGSTFGKNGKLKSPGVWYKIPNATPNAEACPSCKVNTGSSWMKP